jgi:small GTP-binding protein
MPAAPKQRKVALVGSRSVGKSSLTVQFVEGHFVETYYPTIENTFSKTIRYKGQDYTTEIIDTAGQVSRLVPQKTMRKFNIYNVADLLVNRMNIVFCSQSTLSVFMATCLYTLLAQSRLLKWSE